MLFLSQIATLKIHSRIPFGPPSEICCKWDKKEFPCSSFFSLFSFFNGFQVYVTCNQVAANSMLWILNFSRDQHDICIDIMHVFFRVPSSSKCRWLSRITDNPAIAAPARVRLETTRSEKWAENPPNASGNKGNYKHGISHHSSLLQLAQLTSLNQKKKHQHFQTQSSAVSFLIKKTFQFLLGFTRVWLSCMAIFLCKPAMKV